MLLNPKNFLSEPFIFHLPISSFNQTITMFPRIIITDSLEQPQLIRQERDQHPHTSPPVPPILLQQHVQHVQHVQHPQQSRMMSTILYTAEGLARLSRAQVCELVASKIRQHLPCRITYPSASQQSGSPGPDEHTGVWAYFKVVNSETKRPKFEYGIIYEDPLDVQSPTEVKVVGKAQRQTKIFSLNAFTQTCYYDWDVEGRYSHKNAYKRNGFTFLVVNDTSLSDVVPKAVLMLNLSAVAEFLNGRHSLPVANSSLVNGVIDSGNFEPNVMRRGDLKGRGQHTGSRRTARVSRKHRRTRRVSRPSLPKTRPTPSVVSEDEDEWKDSETSEDEGISSSPLKRRKKEANPWSTKEDEEWVPPFGDFKERPAPLSPFPTDCHSPLMFGSGSFSLSPPPPQPTSYGNSYDGVTPIVPGPIILPPKAPMSSGCLTCGDRVENQLVLFCTRCTASSSRSPVRVSEPPQSSMQDEDPLPQEVKEKVMVQTPVRPSTPLDLVLPPTPPPTQPTGNLLDSFDFLDDVPALPEPKSPSMVPQLSLSLDAPLLGRDGVGYVGDAFDLGFDGFNSGSLLLTPPLHSSETGMSWGMTDFSSLQASPLGTM
jgi:hypothetical protein